MTLTESGPNLGGWSDAFLTPDSYRAGGSAKNVSVGTDPLTLDRYSYVNGDPVNLVDPTGHAPCIGDGTDIVRCFSPSVAGADVFRYYYGEIRGAADKYGIDAWMLGAILAHESNQGEGNFAGGSVENIAIALSDLLHHSKSVGLGRIEIATAQDLQALGYFPKASRHDTLAQLVDDRINIQYSAAYLSYIRDQLVAKGYGATDDEIIGAYNVGLRNFFRAPNGPIAREYVREVRSEFGGLAQLEFNLPEFTYNGDSSSSPSSTFFKSGGRWVHAF